MVGRNELKMESSPPLVDFGTFLRTTVSSPVPSLPWCLLVRVTPSPLRLVFSTQAAAFPRNTIGKGTAFRRSNKELALRLVLLLCRRLSWHGIAKATVCVMYSDVELTVDYINMYDEHAH